MSTRKIEELENILAQHYQIDNTPCARTYIFPDGKFLHLDSYKSHAKVKQLLQDEYGYTEKESELEDYGVIRVNLNDEGFVALSKIKPTEKQYDSLTIELDKFFNNQGFKYGYFMLIEPQKDNQGYYSKSAFHYYDTNIDRRYSTDEFIKLIKNYYASGVLKEKLN